MSAAQRDGGLVVGDSQGELHAMSLRAVAGDAIADAFAMKRELYGKVNCPECGKRVKAAGLTDHTRVVHARTEQPE